MHKAAQDTIHRLGVAAGTIFHAYNHILKVLHYAGVSTSHPVKIMPSSLADNAIMTLGDVADYLTVTGRTIYRLRRGQADPPLQGWEGWRFLWTKAQSLAGVGEAGKK